MGNKLQLLKYIDKNGKDKTWRELAHQFGYSNESSVRTLVKNYQKKQQNPTISTNQESYEYNLDKGEMKVSHVWDHAPTPEEVIKHHKIDEIKWKLSNVWIKMVSKGYLTSALFSQKKQEEKFTQEFTEFIKNYKTPHKKITKLFSSTGSNGALVINKQDSHLNKYDIGGDNDITDRFDTYLTCLDKTLTNAGKLVKLKNIVYIIGSDEYNSEWTNATTKGTPQQNILPYNVSFNMICNHEVEVINRLLQYTDNLKVIYLQGNHDTYVGFHMISWLDAYYRTQPNLTIDMTMDCTKYLSVYDTAICLNHGDVMKPEKLAQNFPVNYKQGFAKANFWAILTGDKHTELSRNIGGIKFYQIPALSKSVSKWDEKMGFDLRRAEMTSFLIEEGKGINYIIKEPIFEQ